MKNDFVLQYGKYFFTVSLVFCGYVLGRLHQSCIHIRKEINEIKNSKN